MGCWWKDRKLSYLKHYTRWYADEDSRRTSRHRKMPGQSKTSDVLAQHQQRHWKPHRTMRYMSETQVQAGKRANGTTWNTRETLAEDRSKNFLVVVDYISNYPEVAKLEDLSSTNTISHMKSIMARHGLPSVVVSDNGPQFSSREFRQFAMQYGFKHVTSSPEYPQSNGKAEKAVQIVKRLLKKAKENYEDPYLALLN